MKFVLLTIVMIFLFLPAGFAQNKQIDSLLLVLKKAKPDTNKVHSIFELGVLYEEKKYFDEIIKMGMQALSLSQELNYKKGAGLAYLLIGKYYRRKENYDSAFTNSFTSLKLLREAGVSNGLAICFRQIAILYLTNLGNSDRCITYLDSAANTWHALDNKKEEANIYTLIGTLNTSLGNIGTALDYLYKSLRIQEELGDKNEIAGSLSSIGYVYTNSDDDSLAVKYLSDASEMFRKLNDKISFADNNAVFGDLYLKQRKYTAAFEKYNESLQIFKQEESPKLNLLISRCYNGFGNVYHARGDSARAAGDNISAGILYEKALQNYVMAIEMNDSKFALAISDMHISMGKIYFNLMNLPLSKKYLTDGLKGFDNSTSDKFKAEAHLYLSKIDSIEGNVGKAYYHYQQYNLYNIGSLNNEMTKKVEFYKAQMRIDQKEKELQLLSKESDLKTALASKQNQQKNFAYAGIALLLLFGGYGFYRYRLRKKAELEQTKIKDRLQISQGLHDDIGSTLSSISVYSQVAQKLSERNDIQELSEMLGKISNTSNDMVSDMSDIVWAINPKNDNMEKIIQRMESFAKPMLSARNIQFQLKYEPAILTTEFNMEKRKNFYLVFKEAINNAFKYAGCSKIETFISNSNKHLKLTIKDNGVGFDLNHELSGDKMSLSGNGLKNMHMRAAEMNGKLTIESVLETGTEVELIIPIP